MTEADILNPVHYEDSTHTYFTGDLAAEHQVFTSVTTLIAKYKQPFDSLTIATNYARKNGGTAEYWMEEWKKKSAKACEEGTALHAKEENKLYTTKQALPTYNPLHLSTIPYIELPDGIYPEMQFVNHEFKVAGRVDQTTIRTVGIHRVVDIDDHKTGKPIVFTSYQSPHTNRFKMMQYPVEHLMDCNGNHYAIQLSLYAYMAECMGFKVGNLRLIHHDKEGAKTIVPVDYKRIEVITLLNHHNEK